MPSPSVTVIGKLETIAGSNDPGQIVVTLVNFPENVPPRISGTMVVSQIQQTVKAAGDGTFSITLWGNYQLAPANTAYQIAIYPAGSTTAPTVVAEYIFGAAGTYDLSSTTPVSTIVPNPPPIAGAVWSAFGRTGVITAQTGDYAFSQLAGSVLNSQLPSSPAYQFVQLTADGVTDNYAVLAAALAAVPANGGTIFLVPTGSGLCYFSQSVVITTVNTVLTGSGWGETSLLSDQGACTLQFAAGQAGIIVNSAKSTVIENLSVLSKDTGATSGDNGIWYKGQSGNATLRNVSVQKFGGVGILIDSTSGGNIDQWRIDQCFVYENFGDGFKIVGGTDGNVGIATGLNCTSNGGWGMNLDSGAAGNTFIIPQFAGNAGGGIRCATSNNTFLDVYMESTSVSSFLVESVAVNNHIKFRAFGQPTTITNNGGLTNVIGYNDANGYPGVVNFNIATQNFGSAGRTYFLTNGAAATNDFSLHDDVGNTWIQISNSTTAVLFPKAVKFSSNIGFYGTTPIAKPTITGSKAANAALASLLTQLAALGLVTDSTT